MILYDTDLKLMGFDEISGIWSAALVIGGVSHLENVGFRCRVTPRFRDSYHGMKSHDTVV